MAQNPTWREDRFFDVLVAVLSNKGYFRFQPVTVARIITKLPRVPISRHAPHYSVTAKDFIEELSEPQRLNLKTEWLPHELGRLIGAVLKYEEELDYMVNIIRYCMEVWAEEEASRPELFLPGENKDDVPLRDRLVRAGVRWNDFVGYAGTIATDAAASEKHWVDEDWSWIINDIQHDMGEWAHQHLDGYGKTEHMIFIADMIAMLSVKLGDYHHDWRMIQIALNMICVPVWPANEHAMLAEILKVRMKDRRFTGRAKRLAAYVAGLEPKLSDRIVSQSTLWEAPPYWLQALHGKAHWSLLGKIKSLVTSSNGEDERAIIAASNASSSTTVKLMTEFDLVQEKPDRMTPEERLRLSLLPKDHPDYRPYRMFEQKV